MGLIEHALSLIFGSGRNVVRDTLEVFRPNAEAQSVRDHHQRSAALRQFAREFYAPRRSFFDRFMDGLNRLPRPALALGTLGLFISAMVDPVWFAARMSGLAYVPEPLWWLLGAIVSFYFGARHQLKGQEFQKDLAARMALAQPAPPEGEEAVAASAHPDGNAALDEWRRLRGERA